MTRTVRPPFPLWRILHACSALALCLTSGCAYDVDRLKSAAAGRDAATDATVDSAVEVPKQLIDLFEDAPFFDGACRRCALNNCGQANDACHDDPECEAVTACLAQEDTPRNHAACRAEHLEWFAEHMLDIDVGGSFYDCVFSRNCQSQCGADQDLSCLGDYTWPSTPSGTRVPLSLSLVEALKLDAAANVTAKVCRIEDVDCAQPSSMDKSDADGRVDLELPAPLGAFTGYIEITGGDLAPTLLVFGWPVATADARRMPIVSASTVTLQQMLGGVPPGEDVGMVQVRLFGCGGTGLADVSVNVKPEGDSTRTWYFNGQLPTFNAEASFDNGNAGVINVPTGPVEVVARRASNSKVVARWTVPVRAEHLTILMTAPQAR